MAGRFFLSCEILVKKHTQLENAVLLVSGISWVILGWDVIKRNLLRLYKQG